LPECVSGQWSLKSQNYFQKIDEREKLKIVFGAVVLACSQTLGVHIVWSLSTMGIESNFPKGIHLNGVSSEAQREIDGAFSF